MSGDVSARGGAGDTDTGGDGGALYVGFVVDDQAGADVILSGYADVLLDGGAGFAGGDGGMFVIDNPCPGLLGQPIGGVANFADISLRGGNGTDTNGGNGGYGEFLTCDQPQAWALLGGGAALNAGDVDATGGDGAIAGAGGAFVLWGRERAENRGDVVLDSGTGSPPGGLAEFEIESDGPVLNSGNISARGSDSAGTTGDGGPAQGGEMFGSHVENTGAIDLSGGNGGTTSGAGGEGGSLQIFSFAEASTNSGALTVSGGDGGTVDGVDGRVLIDGGDATP
jgi:hypothetical protein